MDKAEIAAKLRAAERMIFTTIRSLEALDALHEEGYDQAAWVSAQELYRVAADWSVRRAETKRLYAQALRRRRRAWQLARHSYRRVLRLARALEAAHPELESDLRVLGPVPRSPIRLMIFGEMMAGRILESPAALTAAAALGASAAQLTAEHARFVTYGEVRSACQKAGYAHSDSRRKQAQAIRDLDRWMSDFERKAREALVAQPDLLVALGLPTRLSERRRRNAIRLGDDD